MSQPDETKIPARSRFGNIVQLDDVPSVRFEEPSGRYGASSREVALALSAQDLGFCVVSLDPGKRSCPYHFHHGEEELFHVLSGSGTLRQGDGEGDEESIPLRAGDFVSFPADTGIAHQFKNEGAEPFVYLAISNRVRTDVCEYPDSNKILVRGPRRRMLRREPMLEYFDGEVDPGP